MITFPWLEAADSPTDRANPRDIVFEEMRRSKPSLDALGIAFSVSRAKARLRDGKPRRLPYFACCYNVENLGNVNIVAFYYPLVADWGLLEGETNTYRRRIRSAIREEMIHAVQVITVKKRYDQSPDLIARFENAEDYYESLLGRIIEELATSEEGNRLVLTAAKLYYEDWTINSMERLRRADQEYHGRDGYLVSELIRQLVQIRFGEPTTEEAKGKAWDKNRIFYVGSFGTTENLLRSMAETLRRTVPKLPHLSPTLVERSLKSKKRFKQSNRHADSRGCDCSVRSLQLFLGHRCGLSRAYFVNAVKPLWPWGAIWFDVDQDRLRHSAEDSASNCDSLPPSSTPLTPG